MHSRRPALTLACALLAIGAVACRRRAPVPPRDANAPPTGPALAREGSRIASVRALDPPRSSARGPFMQVVLVEGGALGLARGRLVRVSSAGSVADTRPVEDSGLGDDPIHSIASGGGDVVYALVAGRPAYLARSDDGGRHFVRGAVVAANGPLVARPDDPTVAVNVEGMPGLAAHERTVVFWRGETVLASFDGGSTVAPVDLSGVVRALTVTARDSLVAIVRLAPPPDGDRFGVVRVDRPRVGRAAARAVRTLIFEVNDACAAGRVFALADGGVLLGGARGVLGQCARRSRDDGRTFEPLALATDRTTLVAGSPSGALLVRELTGDLQRVSEAGAFALPHELLEVANDISATGRVAIGLLDGMALHGTTEGPDAGVPTATIRDEIRDQFAGTLAFTATRDAIAAMNGHGTIRIVRARPEGGVQIDTLHSPCRFASDAPRLRDLATVALDGHGRVCCTSQPLGSSTHIDGDLVEGVRCASLSDGTGATFSSIESHAFLVSSGEGSVALFGRGAACLMGSSTRPVAVLGLADTATVLELSCASTGETLRGVAAGARVGSGFASPFQLLAGRDAPGRALEQAIGLQPHLLARTDGSVVAALDVPTGVSIRVYGADGTRANAEWTHQGPERASSIAPWDAVTSIASLRTSLVVARTSSIDVRPFAANERYEAVARVGDVLVGVTEEGRFHELAVRE